MCSIPLLATLACLAQAPAIAREANEFICGPRCVQRVLEHYGQDVELTDLVRELQGATVDRPASLAEMTRVLESRHVYAAGVRLSPRDLRHLSWPDAVIAHFNHGGSSVGHFRVLFADRAPMRVWDGLAGESAARTNQWAAHASGTILLTSRSPIADAPRCVETTWPPARLGIAAGGVAAVFLAARAFKRAIVSSSV